MTRLFVDRADQPRAAAPTDNHAEHNDGPSPLVRHRRHERRHPTDHPTRPEARM